MRDEVDGAPDDWEVGGERDHDAGALAGSAGLAQDGTERSDFGEGTSEPSPGAEENQADDAAFDAAFDDLLRCLRSLAGPCAPPVGEGAFDILYASVREIVVWHLPAKEGATQREVVIPGALARVAWKTLLRGEPVDEAALRALARGPAGGSWLFALLAQAPGVVAEAQASPPNADAQDGAAGERTPVVALVWRGDASARRVS